MHVSVISIVQLVLLLLSAALFPGIVNRTKALLAGRFGPGIWQPMFDMIRLFKKGIVLGAGTSEWLWIGPSVNVAAYALALAMVPFGKESGLLGFEGDFLLVAYLMALGRLLSILSALDTGSAFQGMGANREAILSWLVEPAFFIVFASLCMASGHTSMAAIFADLHEGTEAGFAVAVLATVVLFQAMMVESSRFPVNDPRTHLELTMIHEVMILDNSGIDLALIQVGVALKFAVYAGLMASFFIPLVPSPALGLAVSVGFQSLMAITVGFQESFRARNRLNRNPQMVLTLSALALLVFFAVLIVLNKFSL